MGMPHQTAEEQTVADWHLIDLEFVAPPESEALVAANEWLQAADYDAPTIQPEGWKAKSWRSPMVAADDIAKRLGEMGLVCRLRMVRWWDDCGEPNLRQAAWIPSSPLASEPSLSDLYGLLHRAVGDTCDANLKGDISAALAKARSMGWRPTNTPAR